MGARASSFEAEVAALRAENARLRRLLDLTPEQARPPAATQTGLFLDRPHRRVRDPVGERRTGRSGWSPAVEGGWRKGTNRPYLP
jgi:hypothetical protein